MTGRALLPTDPDLQVDVAQVADWIAARCEVSPGGTPVHMDELATDYALWASWQRKRTLLNSIFRGDVLAWPGVAKDGAPNMVTGIRLRRAA